MDLPPDVPEPAVPEIPECDVTAVAGGFLLMHRRTRTTATAATVADAVIEGIALRVAASWRSEIIPFRAGDPT
jgi:hypothetical protein